MLFSESNGRLLAEVKPADCDAFESHFTGALSGEVKAIGLVWPGGNDARLSIASQGQTCIDLPVGELVKAWNPQ
jgi:hypothetical protein